ILEDASHGAADQADTAHVSPPGAILDASAAAAPARLSLCDTLRFQFAVTIPSYLYGSVAPRRWLVPWLARWDVARHAGRVIGELRHKHAGRDIWLLFPFARTLLVTQPRTRD